MRAVIEAGGKQYLVQKGQELDIELVGKDKKLAFEPLLIFDDKNTTVGTPTVKGARVSAEVIDQVKGDKIKVLKFKPKKRVRKLTGHRQKYSRIKITGVRGS